MTKNPNEIYKLIENSENVLFLKELQELLQYMILKVDNQLSYFNKNKMTLRRLKLMERKDEYESLFKYVNKKITKLEKSDNGIYN
jgi:hypothetical protein